MNIRLEDWEAEQMRDPEFRAEVEKLEQQQMTIDRADQTHDWNKHIELPLCKICGMSKISAHIWGDDRWTKEPIACLIATTTSTTTTLCPEHSIVGLRRANEQRRDEGVSRRIP